MKTEIIHKPSFAAIQVELHPGEKIIAGSDAMASMSKNVSFDTKMVGGFFKAMIRRTFGRESMFMNTYSLENGEKGEIVLTQRAPGDIECLELNNEEICLQPSAFVSYSGDIDMKIKWAGFKSMLAREGLFRIVLSGKGKIWFGAYGGIIKKQIKGEYIVDTSHIVGYEPHLKLNLQMSGGIFSSFFSGEGLVTRVEGDGIIYIQSRSIQGLLSWINPKLP